MISLQAFSNIFGHKLVQVKPEARSLQENLIWPTSDFSEIVPNDINSMGSKKSSKLNVLHPNSPYGLIHHVITPSLPKEESMGNQRFSDSSDLGGLNPEEIWLSDGNLLVLKGGVTPYTTNSIEKNPGRSPGN